MKKSFRDLVRIRKSIALSLIALGCVLGWQSLGRAANPVDDPDNRTASVWPGIPDFQMFGKTLSTERFRPESKLVELKPGLGPVVPERLRIPALSIDASVEGVGILPNGAMDVPANIWSAGWLYSNPRPGDVGNAVIAGHKDSVTGSAVFGRLAEIKAGDKIYVSDSGGYELTFEVTEVQSYAISVVPLARIFGPSDAKQLNLISCDGTFLPDQYTYDKRIIVYTRLVENS